VSVSSAQTGAYCSRGGAAVASDSKKPLRTRHPLPELRQHRLRRGWSLEDVARQLIELGIRTAEPNLGVNADMVGRWERGERSPRPPYPKLLTLLYGCSAEELGIRRRKSPEQEAENEMERRKVLRGLGITFLGSALGERRFESKDLLRAAERPIPVDANAVQVTEEVLAQVRRIDDLLGSRAALPSVLALGNLVAQLLQGRPRAEVRLSLLSQLSQISQLQGWLAFDMADNEAARAHFKDGLQAAHEARDEALGAYILGYSSILATYSGEPQEGLAFAQAAQSRARRAATGAIRSWIATVEAEAWANLGVAPETEEALDRARTALGRAKREDDPSWIYHYDEAGLKSAAGTCYLLLGLTERARAAINEAIALSRTTEVREQAIYRTRLAAVCIPHGEIEEACRLALDALEIAEETRSERAVHRVRELREQLEHWSDAQPVRELDDRLAGVTG
jgi:tetratricopeptide (TPR) repeat protein